MKPVYYYRYAAVMTIVALLVAAPVLAQAPTDLPDLGDRSASIISASEEHQLGEEFMRTARRRLHFLDDPELNAYLQNLGSQLAAQSGAGYEFHFFIIDDPTLNAFAVPGGFIGVHTGLILTTQTESELASVLAHESAHVSQRHLPRMIARASERSLPTMAALIAAAMLGGQAGEAAIALTAASSAKSQIDYTREFEREADRIGMQILARSGYDPKAMPAFFERLQQSSRLYDTGLPEFLRTHPVTSDRIAESRERAERYKTAPRPLNPAFYRFQARVRVLTTPKPQQAVDVFAAKLKSGDSLDAESDRYGYALALSRAGRHQQALAQARQLLARHPSDPDFQSLMAEIQLGAGDRRGALATLEAAHRQHPRNLALTRRYADALQKSGRAAKARQLLERTVRDHPDDPNLQQMLASAAGDSGDQLTAHRALAEYYYLSGNVHAAIDQLQIARRYTGSSFYNQASLEARIKEMQDEAALYKSSRSN
jgi:predicted Zn-dependent protease